MNIFILRLITTIGSIFCVVGCATVSDSTALPASGVHAPATRLERLAKPSIVALPDGVTELETIDLNLVYAYAEAHAPALLTAKARVGVSRADQVEASFTFPSNPTLTTGLGARRANGATGFDYELSLSQTFEVAGEQSARRLTADLQVKTAQAVMDEVRWLTHVEVHRLAWLWLALKEQRARAEMVVEFSKSMMRITQAKIAAGEVSPLNVLVVKADLAKAKAQLVEVIQQESAITTRLAAVVGWPNATFPALTNKLPSPRTPLPVEGLLEQLATHHPSIRQRELAVEARRARLAQADREAISQAISRDKLCA